MATLNARDLKRDRPGDPPTIRELRARLRAERLTITERDPHTRDNYQLALDAPTASLMLAVYHALSPENAARYASLGPAVMHHVARELQAAGAVSLSFS